METPGEEKAGMGTDLVQDTSGYRWQKPSSNKLNPQRGVLEGQGTVHIWKQHYSHHEPWHLGLEPLLGFHHSPACLYLVHALQVHISFLQQLRDYLEFHHWTLVGKFPEKNAHWTSLGHESGFEPRQRGSRDCTLCCLAPDLYTRRKERGRKESWEGRKQLEIGSLHWWWDLRSPSWPISHLSPLDWWREGGCYLAKANSICSIDEMTLVLGAIFTWAGSKETLGPCLHMCAHTTAYMYPEHTTRGWCILKPMKFKLRSLLRPWSSLLLNLPRPVSMTIVPFHSDFSLLVGGIYEHIGVQSKGIHLVGFSGMCFI